MPGKEGVHCQNGQAGTCVHWAGVCLIEDPRNRRSEGIWKEAGRPVSVLMSLMGRLFETGTE